MPLRQLRGSIFSSTVVFTNQVFARVLSDTDSANGANGLSIALTSGQTRSGYVVQTAGFGITGNTVGDFIIRVQYQASATQVDTKVRVHRVSVSGTTPTILASSEYSASIRTNKVNQPYTFTINQVDLGTWASTDRLAVEYTYTNNTGGSITPQHAFGPYGYSQVFTPYTVTNAVGWTNSFQVGRRPVSFSRGGIKGTSRYGYPTSTETTSSGTATGVKGGSDFSGSVAGISTSGGTATGQAGFIGVTAGTSISSGVVNGAPALAGYASGTSQSQGTATGTKTDGQGGSDYPAWVYEHEPKKTPAEVLAIIGAGIFPATYTYGKANGQKGTLGQVNGVNVAEGVAFGFVTYYGQGNGRTLGFGKTSGLPQYTLSDWAQIMLISDELEIIEL